MCGQKTYVRPEFHQVMHLTMTVRMEQYQIVQVVASPFATLYLVMRMNRRITFEALATDRTVPVLPAPQRA